MVCMAALQVFIVRFFFQGARKGTCYSSLFVRLGDSRMLTPAAGYV